MTARTVNVTLLSSTTVDVLQSQNPLEVEPDDTVTWRFVDNEGNAIPDALIDFRGFLSRDRTPIAGPERQPFTEHLPGPSPKPGPFTVADTERGLYLYVILREDRELNWAVPLFRAGNFNPFFGGIIIRDPQGGGG